MDSRSKQQVKDDLIAHLAGQLAGGARAGQDEAAAASAELGERRVDGDAQRDEAGDLHGVLGAVDARQRLDLKEARALDVATTDTVQPGAVVELGGRHYVVGVVTDEFESGGVSYQGIATDAPIYDVIHGLRAGDTFSFGGQDQTITAVD
ncbi:hypothetical protein [Arsenicicoccus sp. oral taxon 190]|uniref:hypothetical protein n=1 Tax=Arsenicicoccus sp. oral taxon 190 TaxID=1658671 RepID=UPI00067B548B|nr:hypothetical protein [Arsenicicoccus sp. oral taxon 190]